MISREYDRFALTKLKSFGSDLSKPTRTMHSITFDSAGAARSAARELERAGYQKVSVERFRARSLWQRVFGPHRYFCCAWSEAIPSETNVFATTDQLNALAERFGGDYDGWEACIVE